MGNPTTEQKGYTPWSNNRETSQTRARANHQSATSPWPTTNRRGREGGGMNISTNRRWQWQRELNKTLNNNEFIIWSRDSAALATGKQEWTLLFRSIRSASILEETGKVELSSGCAVSGCSIPQGLNWEGGELQTTLSVQSWSASGCVWKEK